MITSNEAPSLNLEEKINKIMIDGGAGLINVPLDKWEEWNNLLSEFYQSNEMDQLKEWTYKNTIQGVVLI